MVVSLSARPAPVNKIAGNSDNKTNTQIRHLEHSKNGCFIFLPFHYV